MFHIALYEPEIPPNTGNVIRLCANVGAQLHLIEPLGFQVDDARLRRAGLDYQDWNRIKMHPHFDAFIQAMMGHRIFACSTKGQRFYTDVDFQPEDVLLFGPETRGLPDGVRASLPPEQIITIPMMPNNRSLNLSNSVAVIAYEAWRQSGFLS